jgi:hypothetical protein
MPHKVFLAYANEFFFFFLSHFYFIFIIHVNSFIFSTLTRRVVQAIILSILWLELPHSG